ncbi:related to origin recognition protein Orc1p [Serendipita indica DSM 11827]|uniref:Origin recognition complex subunit 1 n=1 Tax=Serendipita indica (strain DSM 11827) TaxID=1109443 RepID=G4T5S5_SERID|nr:related to origin recognition protein Orc1p [Serendipita indica DSM 11827]
MRLTRSQQATEVDSKISAHATHHRFGDLDSRTTEDRDLLPVERVRLQEDNVDISNFVTTICTGFERLSRQKSIPKMAFRVGDTVEVKSSTKLPIIAVVTSVHEISLKEGIAIDETLEDFEFSPLKAVVHRFELAGSMRVNRTARPHVENEVYYLVKDALVTDVASIVRHCEIVPKEDGAPFIATGALSRYITEASYDPVTGMYFPLKWAEFHRDKTTTVQSDRISQWDIHLDYKALAQQKKRLGRLGSPSSSEEESEDNAVEPLDEPEESDDSGGVPEADDDMEREAMSEDSQNERGKKRKLGAASQLMAITPRRKRRAVLPTPHSKAALKSRRKFKIRPPTVTAQDNTTLYTMEDDPFLRAMYTLHVGERPDTLPCRDDEYVNIFENVLGLLQEASGGCIYISGTPGTGKTATIHTIIRELKIMASNNECNPFTFVEINGLRVPEPNAAYPLLWEAIVGHDAAAFGHLKISPREALRRLTLHFGVGASENMGPACIVLMDELDQLVTTKQDVVYNFFNWPNLSGSKLIVLAVANTHDLPERALSAKVRSRLGMIRINFAPYTKQQLIEIVESRLKRAQEGALNIQAVIKDDAIKYAATRVGGISGDARRVLDICRRTVERTRGKGRAATIADVMHVISLTQNTPTASYVAQCSFHEKTMLAAALMEIRWTGVEEFTWEKLRSRHQGLLLQLNIDEDAPQLRPTDEQLAGILDALVNAGLLSVEPGAIAKRKPLDDRKIILTAEKQEVKRTLVEIGQRWHATLGVDT